MRRLTNCDALSLNWRRINLSCSANDQMKKLTKQQTTQYELEWRVHTRNMKIKNQYDLIFPSLNDYIKNKFGLTQKTNQFKELNTKIIYRRDNLNILSRTCISSGTETAQRDTLKYTGTLIKGISITHKSNLVPVTSREQAIDIAHMRR